MLRFIAALVVFLPLPAAADWTGVYVGGTDALGAPVFVQAAITAQGEALTGTLEVPAQDSTVPLADVETRGEAITFRILTPFGVYGFRGTREGDVIRGAIDTPMGTQAAMHLRRTQTAPSPDDLAGTYRFTDGEYAIVTPRTPGQLRMVGTTSLTSTRLVRIEGDRFLDAGSVAKDPSAPREITFLRGEGGAVTGLSHPEKERAQRLDRIDQERVTFANGPIRLAGTLFKPREEGPHAAAVVVHGSGAVSRDLLVLRAQLLMRRGLAVLLYDKRGTGESSGNWRAASLEELASDAEAALSYLRQRPDIDSARLGLVGHSQAGWIIPIVTSRDPKTAFAVILSGGAVPPQEQESFRSEAQTRDRHPTSNVAQAKQLMTLMWHYARTGEGWEEYEKTWQAAARQPWFGDIAGPRTREDPSWETMRRFAAHDPTPYLQAISVPTLVILGAEDLNHPPERAAKIWRSAIRRSKAAGSEVHVIPEAGHNLMVRQKSGTFVYAPRYVEIVEKWLRRRGVRLTTLF